MPDATDDRTSLFAAEADHAGQRLDKFLAGALPDVSRTRVQACIDEGQVAVNGVHEKASYRLQPGDSIRITLPEEEPQEVHAQNIPLTVLYEDDMLVAIDKPAGMVVHPAYGHHSETLVNAALHHWPQMRQVGPREERAGIVHRLDKGTSGVIVMAKTVTALAALQRQFKERSVYKQYLALVESIPPSSRGIIDAPIDRDPNNRKQMAVVRGGARRKRVMNCWKTWESTHC